MTKFYERTISTAVWATDTKQDRQGSDVTVVNETLEFVGAPREYELANGASDVDVLPDASADLGIVNIYHIDLVASAMTADLSLPAGVTIKIGTAAQTPVIPLRADTLGVAALSIDTDLDPTGPESIFVSNATGVSIKVTVSWAGE